jgi:hypothetical protein
MMKKAAFVLPNNKTYGGTVYLRTEAENGFYQQSQRNADFIYYGASAVRHEQVHLLGEPSENRAYSLQETVFEGFKSSFADQSLYSTLDDWLKKEIAANAP